jgi:hypothetical protein
MSEKRAIVHVATIQQRILLIRGEKVVIDADLAEFYGVPTKRLNEQVKRNKERFPEDFVFQLDMVEKTEVVAKCDHLSKLKYSPMLPYAFTEHGCLMVAGVLNTPRAVHMSLFVVRAFVQMRRTLIESKELSIRLKELERRLTGHDSQIQMLIDTVKQLMAPSTVPKRRRIGFQKREP